LLQFLNMEEKKLNKYEQHRLEKAEREKMKHGHQRRHQLWRYALWLGVLVLLVGTIWQVTRLVSDGSKIPTTATSTTSILAIKDSDWKIGSTTSPVALIEYSDFQCPACAEYSKLVDRLKKDYPEKLTVVYRHYPWFFHLQAMNAALASEAAGVQGQFWAMHDLLFAKQKDWSGTTGQEIFVTYAQTLNLDLPAFRLAMTDKNLRAKIEGQLAEGKSLGIDYTPAFALNGKIIANPRSYEEFKRVIDQAL